MCMTLLGRPCEKYVKGDISIRDSLKKYVSQRGLGSHRPHGATAGLSTPKFGSSQIFFYRYMKYLTSSWYFQLFWSYVLSPLI
jgi:hypothetical protein